MKQNMEGFEEAAHVARYNMDGLEDLAQVPNVGQVIERIDIAATKAAALFRTIGMSLSKGAPPPTLDMVDGVIRGLVLAAAEECWKLQEEARETQREKPIQICVEAFREDELFEVVVDCQGDGSLNVDVYLRLV